MTHRSAEYHQKRRKDFPELYKEKDREKYKKVKEKQCEQQKEKRRKSPKVYMVTQIKSRSKRTGVLFDIGVDDFEIPECCPVLGIPLFINQGKLGPNSPSLDRVDNSKGYVKGNVCVISFKANRYKSDLSLEQVESLVQYMKGNL